MQHKRIPAVVFEEKTYDSAKAQELGGFAGSEGKRGGESYTPQSVVRVLPEMLEPIPDKVRVAGGRRNTSHHQGARRRTTSARMRATCYSSSHSLP